MLSLGYDRNVIVPHMVTPEMIGLFGVARTLLYLRVRPRAALETSRHVHPTYTSCARDTGDEAGRPGFLDGERVRARGDACTDPKRSGVRVLGD